MTTAAERLKSISGFAGATAAAMLLAIGQGATAGEALVDYSGLQSERASVHLLAEPRKPLVIPPPPPPGDELLARALTGISSDPIRIAEGFNAATDATANAGRKPAQTTILDAGRERESLAAQLNKRLRSGML
jgi:hypothetical protein